MTHENSGTNRTPWLRRALLIGVALAAVVVLFQLTRTSERVAASAESPPAASAAEELRREDPRSGAEAPAEAATSGRVVEAVGAAGAIHVTLESDYVPVLPLNVELKWTLADPDFVTLTKATRTDATWRGLEALGYEVHASGERWSSSTLSVEASDFEGRVIELALPIHPSHWIAGIVRDQATGSIVERYEVQMVVRLTNADGVKESYPAGSRVSIQSSEGRFALAGAPLEAQEMRLVVRCEGYYDETTEWVPTESWIDALVVELRPESLPIPGVSGRVLDAATSEPIEGARVTLVGMSAEVGDVQMYDGRAFIDSRHDLLLQEQESSGSATSDPDGAFEIPVDYAGAFKTLVVAKGYRPLLAGPFELSEALDVGALALRTGSRIVGRVLTSGAPEADAAQVQSVSAMLAGQPSVYVRVNPDLTFEIEGLEAGTYQVTVHATMAAGEDGSTAKLPVVSTTVELGPSETRNVDLHFGSGLGGSTLYGSVEVVGEELEEYRIAVFDDAGQLLRMAGAGAEGAFEIADVPDGDFTIVAVARNRAMTRFGANWTRASLPASTNESIVIPMSHSTLSILASADGEEAISIRASTSNEIFDGLVQEALRGSGDSDGLLVVYGLPSGEYTVETEGAGSSVVNHSGSGSATVNL